MDEYVVGAVADIISGNLTPNRPANVKKAKTPIKHQPSPHVTPRSEAIPGREALLSPTLLRKKAVAKKSPKRIFEREDLDKTADEITSPKADKVKKHLQNDLDRNQNENNKPKRKYNTQDINIEETKLDTPTKKKKNKKDVINLTDHSNIAELDPNLNNSEVFKKKKENKSKVNATLIIGSNSEELKIDNSELIESVSLRKVGKNKKNKKSKLDLSITHENIITEAFNEKLNLQINSNENKKSKKSHNFNPSDQTIDESLIDEGNNNCNKKCKNKKNYKSNKAVETNKNFDQSLTQEVELEKNRKKIYKRNKEKSVDDVQEENNTESEHESDNEIESETEQEVKQILDSGPIEGEEDSDDEKKPKQTKQKPEKKSAENKEIGNKNEDAEAKRTLFVGNVPLSKKCKKEIKKIFHKYGTIESVRIRAVPVKDMRTKPKVAAIKNEIHPDRTSVNVYVKFADESSVAQALVENNRVMGEHHLRVSRSGTSDAHDSRRALFVGNIPLGCEDEALRRTFDKCGDIESIRIIRDRVTQLGKGFGYVNFKSSDGVELALNLSDEDLTLKNRILRVRRYTQAAPGQKVRTKLGFGKSQSGGNNFAGQRETKNFSGQRETKNFSGQRETKNFSGQREAKHFGGQRDAGKDEGAFRRIQNKRKHQEFASEKNDNDVKSNEQMKQKKTKKEFVGMTAEKKKKNKKKFDKQSKRKKAIAEILTKSS